MLTPQTLLASTGMYAPVTMSPNSACRGGQLPRTRLLDRVDEARPPMRMPLEDLVEQIAAGALHIQIGKTFQLDEIVEAHPCMEENKAGGKIVALT